MNKLFVALISTVFLFSISGISVFAEEVSNQHIKMKKEFINSSLKKKDNLDLLRAEQSLQNVYKAFDIELFKEVEPNDTFYQANSLKLDTAVIGSFSEYDIDIFKINITKTGVLGIVGVYGSDSSYSLMDLAFGLYDKNDNLLEVSSYFDDTANALIYEDIPVGTYYIAVLDMENYASGDPYIISAAILDGDEEIVHPSEPEVTPIDDNDTHVKGYADPSVNINIEVNGKKIAKGKTNSYGDFSIKINPLKAGTKIEIYATDKNGNDSSPVSLVVLDKTPPATLTINTISTKSKTITGKTEASVKVQAKVGSKIIGEAVADSKGAYKITIKPLKKGTNVFVAAIDKSNNKREKSIKVKWNDL